MKQWFKTIAVDFHSPNNKRVDEQAIYNNFLIFSGRTVGCVKTLNDLNDYAIDKTNNESPGVVLQTIPDGQQSHEENTQSVEKPRKVFHRCRLCLALKAPSLIKPAS